MNQKRLIGILGGLGPLAHIDFETKLLDIARDTLGIQRDQEYPEWILSSSPQIPDRTAAIVSGGESPVTKLTQALQRLEAAGAEFLVSPCNTMHHFLPEIEPNLTVPFVSMIDAVVARISELHPNARVGILATSGTLESALYHDALRAAGHTPLSPMDLQDGPAKQRDWVMGAITGGDAGPGIKAVGPKSYHRELLTQSAGALVDELDSEIIIGACTEIPLVIPDPTVAGAPFLDTTQILAERTIEYAYEE